jgi:hypothetical protein
MLVGMAVSCVLISIPSLNTGFIRIMGLNATSNITMTHLRKTTCLILIMLALTAVLVGLGEATTTSINLKPDEQVLQPVKLIAEDRVLIQFKVIGATSTSSLVHFSLTFPNATVKDFGEIGSYTTSFVCDLEGEYTLNFTNTDQAENRLITLNYEIDHYILGMPQMLFMVILIAVVSVVGVAVFIGLSRKPY